jgi:hypothetical protein
MYCGKNHGRQWMRTRMDGKFVDVEILKIDTALHPDQSQNKALLFIW